MKQMKAAVYEGTSNIRVLEKEIPEIGPKDVLVRNLRSGICGTDINIVKAGGGNLGISIGSEFGHEMAGEVVAIGSEVSAEIVVGQHVAINPITAKKVGRRKSLECSGFSQYVVVEDAMLNHNLYVFATEVPLEAAALLEPMSVGRHGAFSVDPKPGEHIVILGAGPIGLLAAASLIAEGIKDVCVVDIDEWRLAKAKELGAHTVNTSQVSLNDGLTSLFGQVNVYGLDVPDVDAFVDAAGAAPLFKAVMEIVKPQARIAIIAVYKQDVPFSLGQIMSKEVRVQGASGYTHEDLAAVVGHITNHHAKLVGLVTQVYKLDEIAEAFDKAIGAQDTVKVMIDLS